MSTTTKIVHTCDRCGHTNTRLLDIGDVYETRDGRTCAVQPGWGRLRWITNLDPSQCIGRDNGNARDLCQSCLHAFLEFLSPPPRRKGASDE